MDNNQSLAEIFNQKIFRIPDYQRGYAWQKQQLNDFWEDLINLNSSRKHYTGLISWQKIDDADDKNIEYLIKQGGFKLYYIVDGQQRLTTFLILLTSLLDFIRSLPENNDKNDNDIRIGCDTISKIKEKYICYNTGLYDVYLFSYNGINNQDADYFEHKILGKQNAKISNESYYTRNLCEAQSFFKYTIKRYYDEYGIEKTKELYNKLTNKFIFYIQEINDDYDVCVAFETINNRGKSLTNLELLKNRLIYLTTLFNKSDFGEENQEGSRDTLRDDINNTWKVIYTQLGRKSNKVLSDDEFLRAHWITYYTYSRKKGDDYKDFLLNKFSCKSIYKDISDIENINLADNENIYPERSISQDDEEYIENDNNTITTSKTQNKRKKLTPKDIQEYVSSLRKFAENWFYTFYPKENPMLTSEEIDFIERLNYIGIGYFRPLITVVINDSVSNNMEKIKLYKAIERFIFVNFRIAQYFSNYKSSEFYRITKELYQNKVSIKQITENLETYTNENLADAKARFTSKIKRLFDNNEGFYGWSGLKYFLYIYEESLIKENVRKVNWEDLQKQNTIEHIFPQQHDEDAYWQETYKQYSNEEKKQLLSSLGNFLALSKSANSQLQNFGYPRKRAERYYKGSYSEIEVSENYKTDWTATDIYERGLKLLDFMNQEWMLGMNNTDKVTLLHLTFLDENNN